MTTATWTLLAAFLAIAAVDWAAVALGWRHVRYVTKPGCMLVLIAAAVLLEGVAGRVQVALMSALVLSLAGDVFLVLPGRSPQGPGPMLFVAGLGSFLLAHLAYVVGFALRGVGAVGVGVGVAVVIAAVGPVARRVLPAVRAGEEPELVAPVAVYIAVISAMVVAAFGVGDGRAAVGAFLFAGSDSIIAWERFVRSATWMPVAVIVTYHLAQALLLLSFT